MEQEVRRRVAEGAGRFAAKQRDRQERKKQVSEKETVGNTDERVDRVGKCVAEERYGHRNAGSGEGNEKQMHRERDEGRGVEEKQMEKEKHDTWDT